MIIPLEELQKIEHIGGLKSTVPEIEESCPVLFFVVQYKIVWGIVHELEQVSGFSDDGLAASPGKHSCEETRNFNVLLFGETVRDAHRVGAYE